MQTARGSITQSRRDCSRRVATLACVLAVGCTQGAADAPTLAASTQALSINGPYADYGGFEGKRAQEMSVAYRVTNDAEGPAATYFVSTEVEFVNAGGTSVSRGYIGLQPYSMVTGGHTAVFSIFGATEGTYANGTPCIGDADGGPGRSCLIRFNYVPNSSYVMKIQHVGGGEYRGYVGSTLIATIRLPNTVGMGNFVTQWLEPYGGTPSCESAPYFRAIVSVPAFVPAVALSHSSSFDPETRDCYNTSQSVGANDHTFDVGTPPPAVAISHKSKPGRIVYAATTAEGCGGGAMHADGSTYAKCARLVEADRGNGQVLLQTENGYRLRCDGDGSVSADERSTGVTWTKVLGGDGFYSYRAGSSYLDASGATLSCKPGSNTDAQKFFRTLAPPPDTVRIRNVWLDKHLVDLGQGRPYYRGPISTDALEAHWILEDWNGTHKRLKNRQSGLYIHNQGNPVDATGNRIPVLGAVSYAFYSGAWELEAVGTSTYRLKNLWTSEYLTTEKQLGYADLSLPQPGWLSAQWLLEPVVPAENRALTATVTGSSQAAGQELIKARDGVVSGYPADPAKEWASVGQKAGAFLQYTWSTPQTISWIQLSDRINVNDQVTSGTLSFSDGTTVAVGALPNNGAAQRAVFATKSVTWVRFTVNGVSASTANVGLAEFEVH